MGRMDRETMEHTKNVMPSPTVLGGDDKRLEWLSE